MKSDVGIAPWHSTTGLNPDAQPLSASLQVTLRLESTLLGCFRGQPPDPFWVGPVDAETFVCLTAELLSLLTQRDRQGVWTLADHLAGKDWWDNHVLHYADPISLYIITHPADKARLKPLVRIVGRLQR